MALDFARAGKYLQSFDFGSLFREELGWDNYTTAHEVEVEGQSYRLKAVSEKRGMVAYVCQTVAASKIPPYAVRLKIERAISKLTLQHIIIHTDGQTQIWQWVKREAGKPAAVREYALYAGHTGAPLLQKLQTIAFSLDEEETLTLVDVDTRVRAAFDVERITKRFYEIFKTEHAAFLQFIKGIPDDDTHSWYASVMLNRFMFIYFIQKKGFLGGDEYYLTNKLKETKAKDKDRFYKDFLCPLFFEGFAQKERSDATKKLLGNVPYLNGGLFLKHQIENEHGSSITISDAAFDKLFTFFEGYRWHLDERPLRDDREINPDVLGFIFEKYINQKLMGAYYTKEDITGYISKNTIIPFLFDAAQKQCGVAFEGEHSVWRLLQADPDRYIYEAVKKGVLLPLPEDIEAGINDVAKRGGWNKAASDEYALPTEIWREVVARRQKYAEIRGKLESGEVRAINDLITLNLDIRQFAQDVIESSEGPELVRAFWNAIQSLSVLDPTVGSGAFLFAALNILEPLYEACLDRMEWFVANAKAPGETRFPEPFTDFKAVLANVAKHPNHKYFVLKSIIVNNLFGVDIMEEATEICKLRLFLKLASHIEPNFQKENLGIEPLPDIDFNIRAGNTLVGFATLGEIRNSSNLLLREQAAAIEAEAAAIGELAQGFRAEQLKTGSGSAVMKATIEGRLMMLNVRLNEFLAEEYEHGISQKPKKMAEWKTSHQPFHWFIEFYDIMQRGGFDVIIGNPPYVEYSKVRSEYTIKGYETEGCGNLYAFMTERSLNLLSAESSFGFIVPISLVCTQRMAPVQRTLTDKCSSTWVSDFGERPGKLFVGAEVLLTIVIARRIEAIPSHFTTGFIKWATEERATLFERIRYNAFKQKPKPYIIPKIGLPVELALLHKVTAKNGQLGQCFRKTSSSKVFYRIGGGRYWKVFTNFQPKFVLKGKKSVSSRENYLFLEDDSLRDQVIAVLSSSLFFWHFILTTNCRDLNPSDLQGFPIGIQSLSEQNSTQLSKLCKLLMDDYKIKSCLKEKTSSLTGAMTYQEFYPRHSKPIIDEIDRVLAQHYGFTDEELDFIINYDIKYRMGRDAGESDE